MNPESYLEWEKRAVEDWSEKVKRLTAEYQSLQKMKNDLLEKHEENSSAIRAEIQHIENRMSQCIEEMGYIEREISE